MHSVGNSRLMEYLMRENPELFNKVLKEQNTGLNRWYFIALPYAAVTFSAVMSLLISIGNYAGALASLGPVLAAIVGTVGIYRKRGL